MSHAPRLIHLMLMVVGLATLAGCQKAPDAPTPRATTQTLAVTTPPPAPAPPQPQPQGGMAPSNLPPGHPPINPPPPAPGMPAGHPTVAPAGGPPGGGMGAPVDAETGVPLPLPLIGAGSVAELQGRLKASADPATKTALEEAFRKTFTIDRQGRDRATALLEPLQASADPKVAALALRTLAYVAINNGFDTATATDRYKKALALDADYGEAHYAMAFVLAMSDRATGQVHFERAMTLGVPDTRNLRGQFFGAATPPGHP